MSTTVRWLMRTVAVLALVLSSVGIAAADEDDPADEGQQIEEGQPGDDGPAGDDDEPDVAKPLGIHATGQYGNCFSVVWNADPTRVIGYTVSRPAYPPDTPAREWQVPAGQNSVWACEMEPGNTYDYEVCSQYSNKEADTGCDSVPLKLETVGNLEPGGPLPPPSIDPPTTNPENFGVRWNALYDFDFYYLDVLPKGGRWNSIKHDDDGTWGWQRVVVTPGTTYSFRVKGCVSGLFGDPCSGWSPESTVTIDLPYGPDTCKAGFVWRDGGPMDHICVTPERRQKVADDLHTGRSRIAQSDPTLADLTGACSPALRDRPELAADCWQEPKCLDPFVPRGIPGEAVLVCVDQKEADLIKQENANPTVNRVAAQ